MEKVKKRSGISLIVLVITILVMIILAGVVIVTMSENNPIAKAKEATFRQDMQTFVEEFSLFVANKAAENSAFSRASLLADSKICVYNTQKVDGEKNVGDIIKGAKTGKYAGKVEIVQGNLYFVEPNKEEQKILLEMGIFFKGKESGNILVEGDTLIGVSAGYVNTGTLVIPSNVKRISPGAFLGCTGIFQVVVPEGVTSIPEDCFRDCTNLAKIVLPDTLTSVQNRAFQGCVKLSDVNFPNNLTAIWTDAFLQCKSLTKIILGENVTTLGFRVFQECSGITEIKFNNKLEKIYGLAFRNTNITNAILPDSVTFVDDQAFLECQKLKNLHIGSGVNRIGSGITRNCPNLTTLTVSDNNSYFCAVDNVLYTKDKTKLLMVPSSKKNITYPKELTEIGFLSFASNTGLTKISIPEGVTYIHGNAFSETSITTLELPSTVTGIEQRVIEGTANLTQIVFPKGNSKFSFVDGILLETITEGKDTGKKKTVASITTKNGLCKIPEDVVELGGFSFRCNITAVEIPPSVHTINEYAFYSSALESVTIPDTVTTMAANVFSLCKNLVSCKIGEGITYIPDGTFYGCRKLKNLEFGSNVDSFGNQCFAYTYALDNITVAGAIPKLYIDSGKYIYSADKTRLLAASNKDADVTILPTTKVIADFVFSQNEVVTNITIPNGVTTLGRQIVNGTTKLTKLTIPSSVTNIHKEAFGGAASIQELVILGGKSEATLAGSPWGLPKGKFAVKWK